MINGTGFRSSNIVAAKNASSKQSDVTSEVLKEALKRFNDSYVYQEDHWFSKWERDNKLYNGERANTSYKGLADTFVPMTFPMVETIVSALANGSLRFDYDFGDPVRDPDMRAFNGLVDEWWEKDGWDLATEESSREMVITGMSGNMLSWEMDHPHWEYGAMRDFLVDPTIKNQYELQQPGHFAGRRYFIRKGALDDYEVVDTDPESKTYGQMVKRYTIPSDTGPAPDDKQTAKQLEEAFSTSTLSEGLKQQDEIIEICDVDRVVTIMNRCHVIEDTINPFKQRHIDILTQKYHQQWLDTLNQQGITGQEAEQMASDEAKSQAEAEAKGLVPYFFFRNYRRASLFYAKSEIDSIAKHQELLNDMTNLETDIIIRKAKPARELDPEYEDFLDEVDGDDYDRTYPFKPGSLANIIYPDASNNTFANRQNIKSEIREATAISQRAKGIDTSNGDPTATEVRSSDSSTDQRIESKARILEKDGFFWMAYILFRMAQLYITEPLVVRVSGAATKGKETGVYKGKQLPPSTAVFDPEEYQGDFVPHVTLEVDSKSKKVEQKKQAQEEYKMLISDPTNNLEAIKKLYYPKIFDLDKSDLDEIMTQTPEMQMQAQAAQGMQGGQMPPQAGAMA